MSLPVDDEGRPTYRFNPKLLGGEVRVTLDHDALEWSTGSRGGRLAYADITGIKLAFQPANMQFSRYICVVAGKGSPRLTISNGHRVSLTEFEARNDAFNDFVRRLHAKIPAARTKVSFQGGETPLRYGVMVFLTLSLVLALMLAAPNLMRESRSILLSGGFLLLLALLPLGAWLYKNKPRAYDPKAIAADLLPGS